MARVSTKDVDEKLAKLVLQAALGVEVNKHDDGSQDSMYDLDLVYPDGRAARAEVVSTRSRDEMILEARTASLGYVPEPRLTKFWWVEVLPGANIREVKTAIVPILAALERRATGQIPRDSFGPLRDQMDALKVEGCSSQDPSEGHPPGFYLWPPMKVAWGGSGEVVLNAANAFMRTVPDVAAKLRNSGPGDGHAVVVVTDDQFEFFFALDGDCVPSVPPELPDGVDCLWLVTLKAAPVQAVYWPSGGPWSAFSLTAEVLGARTFYP